MDSFSLDVQAAFTYIARGQNEFGDLSGREPPRTSHEAKHSLVLCQIGAFTATFPQEVNQAQTVAGSVQENLRLCPENKSAYTVYSNFC